MPIVKLTIAIWHTVWCGNAAMITVWDFEWSQLSVHPFLLMIAAIWQ